MGEVGLRPFFSFYGSKWRVARRYPAPVHPTIVEPFAGSAGYSLRYPDRNVILVDKDPTIVALWRYLVRVRPSEVMAIPLLDINDTIDDLGNVAEEAKILVGYLVNGGAATPCKRPSKWMRMWLNGTFKSNKTFWGPQVRDRIARQVDAIRHWTVLHGSYDNAPDVNATWFVDPPYAGMGKYYRFSSRDIDFVALGA